MKNSTIVGGALAMSVGFIATTVDVWSNLEFIAGEAVKSPRDLLELSHWSSSMAAVVAVALACFGALGGTSVAFRQRAWFLSGGLILAWVFGVLFSATATLDRVASQRDAQVQVKRSHNVGIERAQAAIVTQRGILAEHQRIAAAECVGYVAGRSDDREWPKCLGARAAAEHATTEIARLETKLVGLGAEVVEDSSAGRIAALLSVIIPKASPQQVATYQPMLLPMALLLSGQLFPALGFLLWGSVAPVMPAPVTIEQPMKDITPSDPVMAALPPPGKAMTNKEFASLLGISEATASRRVREMQAAGLIAVERNGRAVAIRRV